MRFQYCLNTSTIKPAPLLDKIRLTSTAGFAGIELWTEDIDAYLETGGSIGDLRSALQDSGLEVPTIVAVHGWLGTSGDEYVQAISEARRRMEQAAAVGAQRIVASPALHTCDLNRAGNQYRELLELGTETGVFPAMEFLGFVESVHTISQAWKIVQDADHPEARVVMDPFHVLRGGGTVDAIATVPGEQVAIWHWNDVPASPPISEQMDSSRVMPGDGVAPLKEIESLIIATGFKGYVSLELFNEAWWNRDPEETVRVGMEKMCAFFGPVSS